MRGSVTIDMDAPPETVWDVVSDVTGIGRFSPETFDAQWTGGASGPDVGARFKGHVRRNGRWPVYWTTCRVTECDRPNTFAFVVELNGGKPVNEWRYDITASDGGASVTESFSLTDSRWTRLYWRFAGDARGRTNLAGMRQTLERIKAVVEAPSSAS